MTGTLPTDFKLTPQPAEKDLDQMDDPNIEPKYHPQVLRDQRLDLSFSGDAPPLKDKIERGKKAKFERGGEAKAYGKGYIRKQFKSLDFSSDTLKVLNAPLSLSGIDEGFPAEVPNLEELSVSGHSLTTIDNLPPSLISLNAHCNRLSEWPLLPACFHLRHLGLSGNQLTSLDGITPEVAERLSLLSSLDISANLLARITHLKPLEALTALSSLRLSGNPLVLLPQFRTKALAQVPQLLSLDGITVLETERAPAAEEGEGEEGEEEGGAEAAPEEPAEEEAKEEDAEAGEGDEGEEEQTKMEDTEGQFTLRFKVRDIEGLKNPNPAPPEPPEPPEGEEAEEPPEPPPEFEFYTENPIVYYIEIAVPGQDPVKTEEIEWTAPPGEEDGEDAPKMDFELETTITLEASPTMLQWLRWKGLVLSLYMKKKEMPPPPKEEGEEDEEVEPEASEESKGEEKSGEEGEEEDEEEEQEKFIITKLATATIPSRSLVELFAPMELKVEVNKWSEKDDRTVAIDDRETEKFLQPHKPKKDRQKDFDKEMKAKKKGPPPNKKLLAILNFGVELNPEPEPIEEEAE